MKEKIRNWLKETRFIQKLVYLDNLSCEIARLKQIRKIFSNSFCINRQSEVDKINNKVGEFNRIKYFWIKKEDHIV